MDQRVAIIDLGTNTCHLLIADTGSGKPRIIHTEKMGIKLGKAGINHDIIQPDAVQRAILTLQHFKTKINEAQVSKLYAFGTSALRNAKNQAAVIAQIKESTGIEVEVISGDAEAEMIYHGVQMALDLGDEISLIMDIGGGSVEYILANHHTVHWKQSVEMGAQRILEKFSLSDPITTAQIQDINAFFDESLHPAEAVIRQHAPLTLVGSSGTFDTLSDIYCLENSIAKGGCVSETPLTVDYFYSIYERIIKMNRAERMSMAGMVELRVDLIVVGCCLVRYMIERFGLQKIRVSGYSLKEGALAMLSN